jgi:single-stranded DNA-binding protein
MIYLNKLVYAGIVAGTPESKKFDSGSTLVTLRVVYESAYMPRGEKTPKTKLTAITFDCWGKIGESVMGFDQGDFVIIDGHLESNEYKGKEYPKIVADSVRLALQKEEHKTSSPATTKAERTEQTDAFMTDEEKTITPNSAEDDLPF